MPHALEWDDVAPTGAPNDCWEWTAGRQSKGYGIYRQAGAHREAWRRAHPGEPMPAMVRHSCDNPPCVNPAHLLAGTGKDNTGDMWERGRARPNMQLGQPAAEQRARGSRGGMAKLDEEKVRRIRAAHTAGATMYALAREYGVSRQNIRFIVERRTWQHV